METRCMGMKFVSEFVVDYAKASRGVCCRVRCISILSDTTSRGDCKRTHCKIR